MVEIIASLLAITIAILVIYELVYPYSTFQKFLQKRKK